MRFFILQRSREGILHRVERTNSLLFWIAIISLILMQLVQDTLGFAGVMALHLFLSTWIRCLPM